MKRIELHLKNGNASRLLSRLFAAAFRPPMSFKAAGCFYCAALIAFASGAAQGRVDLPGSHAVLSQAATQPRCRINGLNDITIHCDYKQVPTKSVPPSGEPHIALDRAALSFKTDDSNWMRLELQFTRTDRDAISAARTVYIEFDDDEGHNFIRRPLPDVNLAGLVTGRSADFQERLLVPALRPGHYQINLWIPSTDLDFKFNAAHNLLLSSCGVGDQKTGLNKIAEFSVRR